MSGILMYLYNNLRFAYFTVISQKNCINVYSMQLICRLESKVIYLRKYIS